jgi:hypothetical protein
VKKFNEKLQMIFMAAAYAESGEFNTAREIIEDEKAMRLRHEKKLVMRTGDRAPGARF